MLTVFTSSAVYLRKHGTTRELSLSVATRNRKSIAGCSPFSRNLGILRNLRSFRKLCLSYSWSKRGCSLKLRVRFCEKLLNFTPCFAWAKRVLPLRWISADSWHMLCKLRCKQRINTWHLTQAADNTISGVSQRWRLTFPPRTRPSGCWLPRMWVVFQSVTCVGIVPLAFVIRSQRAANNFGLTLASKWYHELFVDDYKIRNFLEHFAIQSWFWKVIVWFYVLKSRESTFCKTAHFRLEASLD